MHLVDLGDVMVETKQLAPGTRQDSVYVFGVWSGGPEEDVDMARLMLATESEP
jgi:hypothetical protein